MTSRLLAVARSAVPGVAPEEEKQQKSALAFFGRDITELARRGKLEPVIGRKNEILRVRGFFRLTA